LLAWREEKEKRFKGVNVRVLVMRSFLCRGKQRRFLMSQVNQHNNKVAVIDVGGVGVTYAELHRRARRLATRIHHFKEPTIACFQRASSSYVATMMATWMAGKRFLPLCTTHPEAELRYFVDDSNTGAIVYSSSEDGGAGKFLANLGKPCVDSDSALSVEPTSKAQPPPPTPPCPSSDALILYTSGTTGRPKGAVHTHHSLSSMVQGLVASWEYSSSDHILHFLPLHHLHGVLNKLCCVLHAGGCVEFLATAQPKVIWERLACPSSPKVTLFMAVPTIYARMIEYASAQEVGGRTGGAATIKAALEAVRRDSRLMACGSAALPDPVMDAWRQLTGQVLLERYGMTECGMILSNPYKPASARLPGHVGSPLPQVEVRLVDDNEREIPHSRSSSAAAEEEAAGGERVGELRVKGPTVFREYLNRREAFLDSFDADGWFKTGDVAVRRPGSGVYAILGRSSTDIIKSKGFKLSALEIERELLSADDVVNEAAVVGRPHPMDGEVVVAVVVPQKQYAHLSPAELKAHLQPFLKTKLASYKLPVRYHVAQALPRNALGKVQKKTLFKDLGITEL
jgi:malonyl-CoA/methylmalonyl-CoA synthetase